MTEIRAKSRKLDAKWTAEIADDLISFHGIDASAEIK
jgi:hypothetical protein